MEDRFKLEEHSSSGLIMPCAICEHKAGKACFDCIWVSASFWMPIASFTDEEVVEAMRKELCRREAQRSQ